MLKISQSRQEKLGNENSSTIQQLTISEHKIIGKKLEASVGYK